MPIPAAVEEHVLTSKRVYIMTAWTPQECPKKSSVIFINEKMQISNEYYRLCSSGLDANLVVRVLFLFGPSLRHLTWPLSVVDVVSFLRPMHSVHEFPQHRVRRKSAFNLRTSCLGAVIYLRIMVCGSLIQVQPENLKSGTELTMRQVLPCAKSSAPNWTQPGTWSTDGSKPQLCCRLCEDVFFYPNSFFLFCT